MNEKIREILDFVGSEKEYEDLRKLMLHKNATPLPMLVSGFSGGARAAFCAHLILNREEKLCPALVLTPSEKEGYKLIASLSDFGIRAVFYPVRDLTLRQMSASHEFERQRLSVLVNVLENDCDCVIATPDALMLYTMPFEMLRNAVFKVENGKDYDPDTLCQSLVSGGYRRVEMVDAEGQFARRGEILDIFSPGMEQPVRIEFWDRSVDRLSYFDLITQRRTDDLDALTIFPVRETQLLPERRADLAAYIQKCMRKAEGKVRDLLYEEFTAIKDERELSCLDKYLPYLYEEKTTLLSYFKNDFLFIVHEYASVMERAGFFETQLMQDVVDLQKVGLITAPYNDYALSVSFLDSWIRRSRAVLCNTFTSSVRGMEVAGLFDFRTKGTPAGSDLLKLLMEDIEDYRRSGYTIRVACDSESACEHLAKDLLDNGVSLSAALQLVAAPHLPGFELPGVRFVLLNFAKGTTDASVKKKVRGRYSSSKIPSEKIASYADLQIGDFVVHASHGIGIYEGIESMCVIGVRRDYVKIRYADNDMLYLPCDQLDALSKYIGSADGEGVRLSKMGGSEWKKTKTKVKAATREMAKELLQLYAARLRKKGFAFSKDDAIAREFADSFEFEETPGQVQAIEEISKDMESDVPMDRLLCGDVGYGKTEVALRAAFKAVMDGKQVAILVPTTILAMQHYQTILSRMRGFGVRCDMISRFRTAKEQAKTLRAVERGEVDILVGTHRMLSKDIRFHDLGLLVIDEEQRFGVLQKEKIKSLSENIDVLTLTATPIPRTLNMAMSGIRDMSVLEEAPNDRLPVQSFVMEYDFGLITEAIRRELRRGGQVFYLCNNINHLPTIAAKLSEAFPDARIEIGNGQMDKDDLSDIWRSLVAGETDILVCTTIIETGVDIPNANTMIIENADKMGLSQLHQIRGRVGRSSRRAYAYFTYPRDSVLTEVQVKRLDAIRDFTEFGAGFKIAMRDLEIRGAGNLLGAEQSGHLYSVGYELYMKLLNEAILEEKGETPVEKEECTVDLGIDAYIPEDYISASAARIDAYRRIALIRNKDDLSDVLDELIDRYGDPPASVQNLLQISLIRALGSLCAMTKIERKNGSILYFLPHPDMKKWTEMTARHNGTYLVSLSGMPYVQEKTKAGSITSPVIRTLTEYLELLTNSACISDQNVLQ